MPVIPPLDKREARASREDPIVSTRVPESLEGRIKELAQSTGHSVSAIVRFLIVAGLKVHDAELAERPDDDSTGE